MDQTVWSYRALYVLIAGVLIFARLLPLPDTAGGIPGPDLLFALTCVWIVRRPQYVPPVLVGLVILTADLLLMRPPGLWAALVVVAAEYLRSRTRRAREMNFALEWAYAAVVIALAVLAQRVVLIVLAVAVPRLGSDLLFLLLTVLSYPVMAFLSHSLLRVRRPGSAETSTLGRRI